MKILFSPSEAKSSLSSDILLSSKNFAFSDLYQKRLNIISLYDEFLQNASNNEILALFGVKNYDENFRVSLFKKGCIKAIRRYTGVAYSHLNYDDLSQNAKNFIDENVLIFSNLFGAILAKDLIPEYKLKQGEKIKNFDIEKFYKENFSHKIDEFLKDELVLDLRASFYEKFYTLKQEHFAFKFTKNKKVISHYAKAYRGLVLKCVANSLISNKDELLALQIDGLKLVDIKKIGLKNELLFEIF